MKQRGGGRDIKLQTAFFHSYIKSCLSVKNLLAFFSFPEFLAEFPLSVFLFCLNFLCFFF